MLVCNLFGGPGAGKSTVAAGVFYFLKLEQVNVELVTEFAKELVYDEALDHYLDQQEYLFGVQNRRMHRLRRHVDCVVTDSPLLLSYVYPELNQRQKGVGHWSALKTFKPFVLDVVRTYNNFNFFLNRPVKFDDRGRAHDFQQSVEIDEAIREAVRATKEPLSVYNADETTAGLIAARVKERLDEIEGLDSKQTEEGC